MVDYPPMEDEHPWQSAYEMLFAAAASIAFSLLLVCASAFMFAKAIYLQLRRLAHARR